MQCCDFNEQKDIIRSKYRGNKIADAPQIIKKWFCLKYMPVIIKTPLSQEQSHVLFVYSIKAPWEMCYNHP